MRRGSVGRCTALALALGILEGCSVVAPPVGLRTAREAKDECMMALASGTLVRNAESGLGVGRLLGEGFAVEWPFGYTARNELGRAVLVDETGKVVAREGDEIQMAGGFTGNDELFIACRGVTVTKPGS